MKRAIVDRGALQEFLWAVDTAQRIADESRLGFAVEIVERHDKYATRNEPHRKSARPPQNVTSKNAPAKRREKAHSEPVGDAVKFCKGCRKNLPVGPGGAFRLSGRTQKGGVKYRSRCRACAAKQDRASRELRQKRAAAPAPPGPDEQHHDRAPVVLPVSAPPSTPAAAADFGGTLYASTS